MDAFHILYVSADTVDYNRFNRYFFKSLSASTCFSHEYVCLFLLHMPRTSRTSCPSSRGRVGNSPYLIALLQNALAKASMMITISDDISNHSLAHFSLAKPLLLGQVVRPLNYLSNKPIRNVLRSILYEILNFKIRLISLEKSHIEQDSNLRPRCPRSYV